MFSSLEKIKSRTGKNQVGRFAYLKQLVEEFKSTQSTDAKHQVMANLANFAYDPINYGHLRSLGILDLFLEQLSEDDATMVCFALGGLCNLALDTENKEYIINSGALHQISECLESSCVQTVIYSITTLMFLISVRHKDEITSDANVEQMLELAHHTDKRIQNLAVIFLEDYCSGDQVHRALPGIVSPPVLPTLNISSLPGLAKFNSLVAASVANKSSVLPGVPALLTTPRVVPCTCGVFLTGQFVQGSRQQPTGYAALMHEQDRHFPCSPLGNKQCANECLGVIVKHLKDSANIICASIDRDCFKERATLWTKNCVDVWENSNMSAGREFCCKDGLPYKCSLGKL